MTMTNKLKLTLSSPFLLLLLFAFNPVKVFGQGTKVTPDCVVFINITLAAQVTVAVPTAPTSGGVGDNRTEGCQNWTLTYQATGAGALTSLDFQAGQSSTTTVTFASWAGTVSTGINPNTSSTGATSTFTTGCMSAVACTVPNSWVRILITRGAFTGTINGVLYGYKDGNGGSATPGSSCTSGVPCVVDGPTAAGAAPTTPPVLVAGQDGAPGNIRTLKTDTTGQQIPSNASFAGADGVSNTELSPTGAGGVQLYTRILSYKYNGATNDRDFVCTLSAPVTFTAASGSVQIVAASGATVIRVCHLSISASVATNFTIQYGTGAACGTGTNSLSGAYNNVTTLALDLFGTLRTPASQALCISSSATITAGGMVTYAQY